MSDRKTLEKNIFELREKLKEVGGVEKRFGKDVYIPVPHTAVIKARDLDDLYFKTVLTALEHGRLNYIDSGSYAGTHRIEFDHAGLIVQYPTSRPLAPQMRAGIPVPTNDNAIEEYFLNYIMDGRLKDNEHYKYSSWIVGMLDNLKKEHRGIPRGTRLNQLEWCINHFIEDGYGTNHCYMTIGCGEGLERYDWASKSDAEKGSTECLRGLSLKIRDKKMDLSCFFRSWDLIGGLPENLGGFALLMEYIVDSLNDKNKDREKGYPIIEPGTLYADSDGLHIYEHHLNIAELIANLGLKN